MSDIRTIEEIQEDIRNLAQIPDTLINYKLEDLANEIGRKFSFYEGKADKYAEGYLDGKIWAKEAIKHISFRNNKTGAYEIPIDELEDL